MEKGTPMELTKIKKIVADIREFPGKIDSAEQAKNARQLLKKYASLSEKIERNVLIGPSYQKDLANIRTEEFKSLRCALKEKANSILDAKNTKSVQSKKPAEKTAKTPISKKTSKAADVKATKESDSKKTVKKSSSKPRTSTAPKEGA